MIRQGSRRVGVKIEDFQVENGKFEHETKKIADKYTVNEGKRGKERKHFRVQQKNWENRKKWRELEKK